MFRAIADSGTRALLIGCQALVALGMPVLTADYDFWIAAEDATAFNEALRAFDMVPNRSPDEARKHGRYVLDNDEHIDVLVAASVSTIDGVLVAFADVWSRRNYVEIGGQVRAAIPSIEDLILTKRFGGRARDADDIRWLEQLKR
jgi:hypothetical protein